MADTHVHAYELELEDAERELQAAQARVDNAKLSLKAKQAELNPAPVVEAPQKQPKKTRVNKPAPKTVKEATASATTTPLSRPKVRGSGQREPFHST